MLMLRRDPYLEFEADEVPEVQEPGEANSCQDDQGVVNASAARPVFLGPCQEHEDDGCDQKHFN